MYSNNGTGLIVSEGNNTSFVTNTWNHYAVTRIGNTFNLYRNGVSVSTRTSSGTIDLNQGGSTVIGVTGWSKVSTDFWNGYISNLRVVKGTAVYTANFTPPTAPLTAITNTSLFLSGTNAGIYDNAIKNDLETVGNAQVSTAVTKYGTGSMKFDGTGDSLVIANNPNVNFGTGDFTIEFWVYRNSASVLYPAFITKGSYQSSAGQWQVVIVNSTGEVFYQYGTSGTNVAIGTLTSATWKHFAITRVGTVLRTFNNGVLQTTTTVSNDFTNTPNIIIGNTLDGLSSYNGYIDDLRVTKGVARYTANFTPPTAAFPNQ